jgi:hypothetical protein
MLAEDKVRCLLAGRPPAGGTAIPIARTNSLAICQRGAGSSSRVSERGENYPQEVIGVLELSVIASEKRGYI